MPAVRELDWTLHPVGDSVAPTVLVLPGGGYTMLASHEAEPIADWVNSLGLHAAVLRYTVGPGCFPDALLDARAALARLRDGGSGLLAAPDRIAVIGFSAGGHLASLLATDTPDVPGVDPRSFAGRPDAAVLCYPVIDLHERLADGSVNGHSTSGRNLLPGAGPELTDRLCTFAHVDAATPPCFVWATADDEMVPAAHALQFTAALASAGVPYEAHVFGHGRHGLALTGEVPEVAVWPQLCASWLATHGWAAASHRVDRGA